MKAVQGLHHLTVMAKDPQRNLDFYTGVLAQRLVKVTVNFDDPGRYHLYYGDETGSPGTIMTFFPWPSAARGQPGNGEIVAAAYAIAPTSLDYWKNRLQEFNIPFMAGQRFSSPILIFADPDGLTIELIAEESAPAPRFWPRSSVPEEHALCGIHSVTGWVSATSTTARLLTAHLGFIPVAQENTPGGQRTRFKADSDGVGLYIDLIERPSLARGRLGAGSVHHAHPRRQRTGPVPRLPQPARVRRYARTGQAVLP